MAWTAETSQGNETGKIHDRVAPFVSGRGLDLGCGPWKLKVPKTGSEDFCLGVDGGYPGNAVTADVVCDVTKLTLFADESWDYIYSSHTLEDMPYPEAVLREWWRLIKPGGNLILYLPLAKQVAKTLGREDWEKFYPDKGTEGANIHHQHDYSPEEIISYVSGCGPVEVLLNEIRGENDEYSFLLVFNKLASNHVEMSAGKEVPTISKARRALVVRYG